MPDPTGRLRPGEARSAGAIPQRRVPQPWPKDRPFRILSIDGGGIRGLFPAAILATIEERCLAAGGLVTDYFDLAVGTSTGGIIAVGLGAGMDAASIRDLYIKRGSDIFPAGRHGRLSDIAHYVYDRAALEAILRQRFGAKLFGDSRLRLCIPAFEGKHSEVYMFKTPHHQDYKTDRFEEMVTVALATAAAPTYFRPLEHGGYVLVDGGLWANNPTMLGVVEALSCFDVSRDQIEILSIGCGDEPYVVSTDQINQGGQWHWRTILFAAMRLQSLAATNQARLLLGPPKVVRIDPPPFSPPIELDDWERASNLLPSAANAAIEQARDRLTKFFSEPVVKYIPCEA